MTIVEPAPHPGQGPALPTGAAPPVRVPASGRAQRRAAARAFRPHRVVPAVLVAAVLAAAGLLVAAQIISTLIGRPAGVLPVRPLTALGQQLRWDHPVALVVAGVISLTGGLVLLAALLPGRSRLIALASADPDLVTGITRTGLRHSLAQAARQVEGISKARIKVRGRRVNVHATSPLRDAGDLAEQVEHRVAERLTALAPLRPLRIKTVVRRREG